MRFLLSEGMRSQTVSKLQAHLNRNGASLSIDGHYGPSTKAAVLAFQRQKGLMADGIAGPQTLAFLLNESCVHEQKNKLLENAAHRLQVSLSNLYAVCEVESNGQGFLAGGEPVILFERHVMYQLISTNVNGKDLEGHRARANRLASLHPDIINRNAGGYLGGIREHQRLNSARLIDEDAALQSTSWGAFQIMGLHWRRLNHTSVQEFVRVMSSGYPQQVDAFIGFIESDEVLHNALQARDWVTFARRYNGPNYSRNYYDVKLQQHYERHATCGCGERFHESPLIL